MIRIEEVRINLYNYYKIIAREAGLETGYTGRIPFVRNTEGDWPAYLLGGGALTADEIRETAKKIRKGVCPPFWIRENSDSAQIDDLLFGEGIRQINYWTGMELVRKQKYGLAPPEEDLQADRITAVQDLRDWLQVVNEEVMTGRDLDLKVFRPLLENKNVEFFRLIRGKKTLSTVMIYHENGISGIYMVATRTGSRGRGYAYYLTTCAMDYFIQKGNYKFVLHSTPLGYPLYKKLGFREKGKFGIYWMVGKK